MQWWLFKQQPTGVAQVPLSMAPNHKLFQVHWWKQVNKSSKKKYREWIGEYWLHHPVLFWMLFNAKKHTSASICCYFCCSQKNMQLKWNKNVLERVHDAAFVSFWFFFSNLPFWINTKTTKTQNATTKKYKNAPPTHPPSSDCQSRDFLNMSRSHDCLSSKSIWCSDVRTWLTKQTSPSSKSPPAGLIFHK